jgi:hypothetical protein
VDKGGLLRDAGQFGSLLQEVIPQYQRRSHAY